MRAPSHAYSVRARLTVLPATASPVAPARPRRSNAASEPRTVPAAKSDPAIESRRTTVGVSTASVGGGAPVTARSTSVVRAIMAESAFARATACRTTDGLGTTVPVSRGSQRENAPNESTRTRYDSSPARPDARPSVPCATSSVPGPRSSRRSIVASPSAAVTAITAESTFTLSKVEAATVARTVARIVAGSVPRPAARTVAVSVVCGARATTAFASNSSAPSAMS